VLSEIQNKKTIKMLRSIQGRSVIKKNVKHVKRTNLLEKLQKYNQDYDRILMPPPLVVPKFRIPKIACNNEDEENSLNGGKNDV
jgi:hypothetical protein